MLFKRCFQLVLVSFLLGCSDEDGGVEFKDTISSVEEVKALIAETRFVIEMPNGQTIDFIPSEQFSIAPSTDYSSPGNGFNYSRSNNPFVVSGSSGNSASLKIGDEIYQFPITFCYSIDELGILIGAAFDPILQNYEAYFAIGGGNYSDTEIISFEPVGVDSFLFFFVDKNGTTFDFGDASFYRESGQEVFLIGSYQASSSGITAQGEAFINDANFVSFVEFYAEIDCN